VIGHLKKIQIDLQEDAFIQEVDAPGIALNLDGRKR